MTVLAAGSVHGGKHAVQHGAAEPTGVTSRCVVRKRMGRMVLQAQTCPAGSSAETPEQCRKKGVDFMNAYYATQNEVKRHFKTIFMSFLLCNLVNLGW